MIDIKELPQHGLLLCRRQKRRRDGVDIAAHNVRLAEAPGAHQLIFLLGPGARHHRIVRVDAEVGPVLGKAHRGMVEHICGLGPRQNARRGTRLKVDALLQAARVKCRVLQHVVTMADAVSVHDVQRLLDTFGGSGFASVHRSLNAQLACLVEYGDNAGIEHELVGGVEMALVAGNINADHTAAAIFFAESKDVAIEGGQATDAAEQRLHVDAVFVATTRKAAQHGLQNVVSRCGALLWAAVNNKMGTEAGFDVHKTVGSRILAELECDTLHRNRVACERGCSVSETGEEFRQVGGLPQFYSQF